jgi:hypothetical protein
MEAEDLLFAFRRGADDNEDAFGLRLHPRLYVDAISPNLEVTTGGWSRGRSDLILPASFGAGARLLRATGPDAPRRNVSASCRSHIETPRR